jgi:hypothetical protein
MTATRPALTPEHRALFRDFVRLVNEMDRCRFVRKYREQDHTVSGEVDDNGELKTAAPDYDWEDFRSFMTVFRKIGIAENEPTHLAKVYKLAGRYASDKLRKELAANRQQVMAMLYGTWTGMNLVATVEGKEKTFTVAELADMVTNGMIFHEVPRHRQAAATFSTEARWMYLWPALSFNIMPIVSAAILMFQSLWQDGILGDADYPEEWQAEKRAWEAAKRGAPGPLPANDSKTA